MITVEDWIVKWTELAEIAKLICLGEREERDNKNFLRLQS